MKRSCAVLEGFIPLASFVRGSARVAGGALAVAGVSGETTGIPAALPDLAQGLAEVAYSDILDELALMRLAALEGFERAKTLLLAGLANDVLGRELALAPADVEAIVARARDRFHDCEPVALAVSPCDAQRVRTPLPTRIDASLEAGDLIVDVRDGALESHFRFRLRTVLDRALLGAA